MENIQFNTFGQDPESLVSNSSISNQENVQFEIASVCQGPKVVISNSPVSRVLICEKDKHLNQENIPFDTVCVGQDSETLISNSPISRVFEWEKDKIANSLISRVFNCEMDKAMNQEIKDLAVEEEEESSVDSMLCDSGSRLVLTGFTRPNCSDEYVMFVNAGGENDSREADSNLDILPDSFYEGGDVLRTDEHISEAGDYPFIYQSARLGNFFYMFNNLPPGDYFVDLHFVEIINTNGPKGMRVFNVFLQEEKILSNFDIFSIVGANKPLQLVNSRVSLKEDGVIVLRFEGVHGSPMVSGICIRKAPTFSVPPLTWEFLICNNCSAEIEHFQETYDLSFDFNAVPPLTWEFLICNNCSAEIVVPSAQKKHMQTKSTAKFEKKIQELSIQCQQKADECYQAWMSLTAANEQLEKVRMELDNTLFKKYSLDQAVVEQAEKLKAVCSMYERDKKFWVAAVNDLEEKVKTMKHEQSQLSHEAHECADSVPELHKMVFAVQTLVAQYEDLKLKYREEQAKRKKLYNQVQDAKGNIRVFCRCRPLSREELSAGYATVVDFDAAKDGDLGVLTGGSTKKTFKFDRVYTPKDDQVEVFADASPLVVSVLDGYNVCIFAYGQTGTGKTFTMEGTEQNRGVNYRTLEQLFKIAKERSDTFTYSISVSVLEVYNEQIRDLLATSPTSKKLEIKQASEGFHHVPGIVEAKVENIKEVWNVLQAGSSARAVGSNNVNEHSSRSHCMLCIMVKAKDLMNGECTKSKLWLVDLAGSERLAKTDIQGERLKEAQNINRSLSALGDVISALATKSSHIPYRNSKLTHLLQDSLGGDSKTLMFVQISPSENDLSETVSSLNFATRVRGVELGPARKQVDTGELQKMKMMLDKARHESRSKDESIKKLEESLQNVENKARGKEQSYKSQQEKIKDLEGQLELKTALHSQSERQVLQISERLKGGEEICTSLQQKVKELENKFREREQSEFTTSQQKVMDLENKLKEQAQEFESHSHFLRQKVKELERQLKEQEWNADAYLLQQKIKELEDKLMEKEHKLEHMLALNSVEVPIAATPNERKLISKEGFMGDSESHILRSSNSINRPMASHGSIFHETRRKRDSRLGETENAFVLSNSLNDKKAKLTDPKPFVRVIRTAAKPVTTTSTQRPFTHNRISRDQVGGTKEKDSRKRIWSR